MFAPFFMVRVFTLVLFEPTPIDVQIQRKGKLPNPPGQLIDTVPVEVMVEPEIRSMFPNGMLVAPTEHCACAADANRLPVNRTRGKPVRRRSAWIAGFPDISVRRPCA